MSQIYKTLTSGPVPPAVPTSFQTDNGIAIPAANILIVHGNDSSSNISTGVQATGGVVGTGTANEVDIVLTNRVRGTVTTANATPTTLTTFSLGAIPGVYNFDIQIVGYDLTDVEGIGYFISGSVRTTGAVASLVGTPDKIINEVIGVTTAADAALIVSGNNAIVQVTGIAGKTINWNALSQYIFVS